MTDTPKKRKGPRSKTGARAIAAAEKKLAIVELRSEPGTSLAEVAAKVGVSKSYVSKVVIEAIGDIKERTIDAGDLVRQWATAEHLQMLIEAKRLAKEKLLEPMDAFEVQDRAVTRITDMWVSKPATTTKTELTGANAGPLQTESKVEGKLDASTMTTEQLQTVLALFTAGQATLPVA